VGEALGSGLPGAHGAVTVDRDELKRLTETPVKDMSEIEVRRLKLEAKNALAEVERLQAERDKLRETASAYMAAINACWPVDPKDMDGAARLDAAENALRRALEGGDQ